MSDELRKALEDVERAAEEHERKQALRAYMDAVKQACSDCLQQAFFRVAHMAAQYVTPDLGETVEQGQDFLAVCIDGSALLAAND